MAYINLSEKDETILSKAWASVAAEKDWSPEAMERERERLNRFLEIAERSCRPKKIVYIFEIEYGDVLVFSDKAKAIQKALDYLATVFKKKATPGFLDAYKKDIEEWLDKDSETGAMGNGEYSSCYIYKREISD